MTDPMTELTVQTWLKGNWHDAATILFHEPEKGHRGSTTTTYLLDYFVDQASIDAAKAPVIDERAISVAFPVGDDRWLPTWPAFLMDMLPQGPARILLGKALGINGVLPSSETHLLAYAAGTPVGNIRIAEAAGKTASPGDMRGLAIDDVLSRSDEFVEFATALPWVSPASVCLQGEWPKLQLTLATDGLLYPDAAVPDEDAHQRYIVKLARSRADRDILILELEAIYAEAVAMIGVPVPSGYLSGRGVIMIPRFDREKLDGTVRHGQESLVSALGVSQFGHLGSHEEYLSVLSAVSSDPSVDRFEYVRRDLLNLALGNDDNHGRNSALSKNGGHVRLSGVFDLAPMRLSGNGIARSSKWACMKETGGDYQPAWDRVAAAVAGSEEEELSILLRLAEFAERLPAMAAAVLARASDRSAAAHAMSRLDGVVRDAVASATAPSYLRPA
ncbi:type II toxin-antitoxin system HipA family toxin [Agrobacterium rubi]|nr:type II toxin-antitoxin system HipA family toxin [Agrobacterium rubi]NTF24567.1 type II toxin-antitoxin system HipA family toxin [Agrobacterium rubi]